MENTKTKKITYIILAVLVVAVMLASLVLSAYSIANIKTNQPGKDGVGILSITKTSTEGLVDTYTITLTNGETSTFTITNGSNGQNGADGVGIVKVEKTSTNGLVDTYTITFTNGTTTTFTITNGKDGEQGEQGLPGADGVGIAKVEKTSTNGLVDTYTITLTNGQTATFTVTNGADGEQGEQGEQGEAGVGIVSIEKTSSVGLVDTYTITLTNGQTSTFTITNGTLSGNVGNVGSVVTRGEYPQTYVGDALNNTLINARDEGTLQATGRSFTTYRQYEKIECPEYIYDGEKYALVESARFWYDPEGWTISNNQFSTGESGYSYNSYFFKVEPIQYRVMAINNETNQMTLQSINALGSAAYSGEATSETGWNYTNSWETSTMRDLLNNYFLTESGLDEVTVEVTNTTNCSRWDSESGNYVEEAEETQDKVWIASIEEENVWYPNEGIGLYSTTNVLAKAATDFALATYAYKNPVLSTTYWVFRTGGSDGDRVYFTLQDADVKVYNSFMVNGWDAAVVPVITVAMD